MNPEQASINTGAHAGTAMNAILTIALAAAALSSASAQTFTFLADDFTATGNFGLGGRVGVMSEEAAWLGSIHAAVTVDHTTTLGIEAVALLGPMSLPTRTESGMRQMVYGGILGGYTFAPAALIHPIVRATVGGGGLSLDRSEPVAAQPSALSSDGFDIEIDPSSEMEGFFVVEPGIGLELNVSEGVRLELAFLYRLVAGVETRGLDNAMLDGPSVGLTLKTGQF